VIDALDFARQALGCLIAFPGTPAGILEPQDFPDRQHAAIFRAVDALNHAGEPWQFPELSTRLEPPDRQTAAVLGTHCCMPVNLPHVAKILRRERQLREIAAYALTLAERARRSDVEPDQLVTDSIARLRDLTDLAPNDPLLGLRSLADVMGETPAPGSHQIVRTGLYELDRHSHIAPGTLTFVAARPGHGKSAMLLDWSVAAAQQGWQVLFFALEMTADELRPRLWSMFPDGIADIASLPLWIQEPFARRPTVAYLVAYATAFTRLLSQHPTLIVIDYVQIVSALREMLRLERPLHEIITEALERTRYIAYLREDPESYEERRGNIEELVTKAAEWEDEVEHPSLAAFLEELTLKSSADEKDLSLDHVRMMTLHNGKGLEFTGVFLVGMEEELFPHANALDSDDALEEERRLCYVGMTRAKEYLYLTASRYRYLWGMPRMMRPSRFLKEIPQR